MPRLVLYQPEIPPNTGNIARLSAATATELHLIEPLGFSLNDRYLKRAGLDYWPQVRLRVWPDWETFCAACGPAAAEASQRGRLVLSSSRQGVDYHRFTFLPPDYIVLGPETRGLPAELLETYPEHVRIPIRGQVRSLNLSTAAGVLLYEALRQTGGLV